MRRERRPSLGEHWSFRHILIQLLDTEAENAVACDYQHAALPIPAFQDLRNRVRRASGHRTCAFPCFSCAKTMQWTTVTRNFLPIATRVHHKRARGSSRNGLGASRARRSCLASAPSDHWRRYTPARIRRLTLPPPFPFLGDSRKTQTEIGGRRAPCGLGSSGARTESALNRSFDLARVTSGGPSRRQAARSRAEHDRDFE